MLGNLQAELARKDYIPPYRAIMNALNCSEKTARNKIKGYSPITITEAIAIRQTYFEKDNFSLEYLFAETESA